LSPSTNRITSDIASLLLAELSYAAAASGYVHLITDGLVARRIRIIAARWSVVIIAAARTSIRGTNGSGF
jgi:hypothetical protein